MTFSEKKTLFPRYFNVKASFTLEASLIFSVFFLLLTALVYVFILLYQHADLQSVTSQTANRGAQYYVKQLASKGKWPANGGLYWRILDGEGEVKSRHIEEEALKNSQFSIIDSEACVKISTSYIYLLRQLKVEYEKRYSLPVGDLLNIFGIPSKLVMRTSVICPLEDNAEFIRNMDMIADIKNCLVNKDNKWIGSGEKINESIENLVNNFGRPGGNT